MRNKVLFPVSCKHSKIAELETSHSIGVGLAFGKNDTDIFNDKIKTCSAKIVNSKSKKFIVTSVYRPPKGDIKVFRNYCKHFFKKKSARSETVFRVGDFILITSIMTITN